MSNNQKKKILVIDDDVETQKLLHSFLDSPNLEIFRAPSGRVGLMMAQDILPDLIILDIRIPDMNGFEICKKLQRDQNLSYSPVIFLSKYGDEENRTKAFTLGGVDFLHKPITKEKLLQTVNSHLVKNQCWQELKKSYKRRDN
ncbi:MAG: PleD family two-component system response regulator [Candidatus Aminicenantes bacterium]